MGVKMDNSENLDGKKQEKKEEINLPFLSPCDF